jgi:hypothetical protein
MNHPCRGAAKKRTGKVEAGGRGLAILLHSRLAVQHCLTYFDVKTISRDSTWMVNCIPKIFVSFQYFSSPQE